MDKPIVELINMSVRRALVCGKVYVSQSIAGLPPDEKFRVITLVKDSIIRWEDRRSEEALTAGSVKTEDEERFRWQFEAENFASEYTTEDAMSAGLGKRPLTIWSDEDLQQIHKEFARRNE